MLLNEARAARLMDEVGLDALLGATQVNVFYLSGVWSKYENLAIVKRDRLARPALAMPLHGVDYALGAFPGVEPILTFGTFYREAYRGPGPAELTEAEELVLRWSTEREPLPGQLDALSALIAELGLGAATVGYDEKGLEPEYVPELAHRFPRLRLVPAFQLFRKIRAIKTPAEVDRLIGALQVTEQAIVQAANSAYEGMTEREMSIAFETTQIRLGASQNMGHIGFGHSGMLGMINQPDDRLRRGDITRFDAGCFYRGYASDLARTFVFGEPSERVKRYYDATLVGQQAAIDFIKPGVPAAAVFERCVQTIRQAGLPHYRRHHVGHGIGIALAGYDIPLLGPKDRTPLEPGMVLEVETPYYEFGLGGLQVEDTVLVTDDGCKILTSISRQLGVLG
jgi:Xaa-Pro dipeptidase